MTTLALCLAVLLALGLVERFAARRARAAVPVRIHVNGTRGKSTITRLIAGGLREAGIPTLAKVTGTAPRLILPDGSERPIRRLAPANIREQAWLLRAARRAGARAMVAECMAVRPDLQWVSEHEMVQATIGVITNVRRDHTEVMGRSVNEIAQSLANSIPRAGVLVTGDGRFASVFAGRCAALGTRMVIAGPSSGDVAATTSAAPARGPALASARTPWWQEDLAVALAVTREVGINDDVALAGMRKAAADPSAAKAGVEAIGGREIAWIDVTAANDPESMDSLVAGLKPCSTTKDANSVAAQDLNPLARAFSPVLVVYNHRADRPDRLRTFAAFSDAFRKAAGVLLTGDRASITLVAAVRGCCPDTAVRFVSRRRIRAAIEAAVGNGAATTCVVFCGNTRGFVNPLARRDSE